MQPLVMVSGRAGTGDRLDKIRRRETALRELLGGYEFWVRNGYATETTDGTVTRPAPDRLVTAEAP